ncbi:MAG: NnrS family protein [Betaproteobacteria bacterium HGW-Betaproteobacteria-14]|nr:MAG: NnrS family protein [Betaproteobacteria bacterium HGW-Betaproteobacteria-14]
MPPSLLSSAFRPFYFLGALYAPLLAAVWLGAWLGAWEVPSVGTPLRLWHGHEMLFGFAAAIIVGIVLTALPSWAGTEEIRGVRLALLAVLWLAGRVAFWAAPWLPALAPAIVDVLLFPAVFLMVAPQLARAANRLYLLLLPILLALTAANLAYHYGILAANTAIAGLGLRAAIYAIIVLYVLKGGVLTPIFTGNALREKGRGEQAPFNAGLETLAVAVVLLLATLDLAGAAPLWTGLAALACAGVHGARAARWKGWRLPDVPLVFVMHLGFAWLVFAFALKAAAELTGIVPEAAWVHAFTVGSLGLMMLGLMTRVSLRHTGRPLVVPGAMRLAYWLMFVAALLRLAATVHGLGSWAVALSAVLWGLTFVVYFMLFGTALLRPSLPRGAAERLV